MPEAVISKQVYTIRAFDLINWCTFPAVAFNYGFSPSPAAAGGHPPLYSPAEASSTPASGMGKDDFLSAPARADTASCLGGFTPANANSTTAPEGGAAAYCSIQGFSQGKAKLDNHPGRFVCGELGALGARTSAHGRPAAGYYDGTTVDAAAAALCCNAGLMQAFCRIL